LSTYLQSFRRYGFNSHVITVQSRETNQIIGGVGLLEFGKSPLKLITVPMGPIIEVGCENAYSLLISETLAYSKATGAFLLQIKTPFSETFSDLAILPKIEMPISVSLRYGFPFDLITVPNQMLWIEFEKSTCDEEWESAMLKRFSSGKRRDIRAAQRKGLSVLRVTGEAELRKAYSLIELNGREQGYNTRSWEQFGPTLIEQVNKGEAMMLVACHEGQFLGAHYGVLAGQRCSYLMGGTVRMEKDNNVGAFLHWQVMKTARAMGLRGYDLTSWGSAGVMEFKKGFRPTHIEFKSPHYFVLSRLRFSAFMKLYPVLKRYKSTFARYVKLICR
jgi:hypothetical protein